MGSAGGDDGGEAAYVYRAASAADIEPVVVTVRVAGEAASLAPRVVALARPIDPGLQLQDIATLETVVAGQEMGMNVGSLVFGSILVGSVTFSAAGLYALMAVAVARRTREIGIVSPSAPIPGTWWAACSRMPVVSSAAVSSPATA